MLRRLTFLLLLFAFSVRAQTAANAPGQLVLDSDNTVAGDGGFSLKGRVRITDGTFLLLADEGNVRQISPTAREATLLGHVQLTRGAMRLLADKLVYNLDEGTFTAENIRLGSHPYFVEGFSAEGSRKEITIHRARLSYGEPGIWQPTIVADKVIIAPGQHVRTEGALGGIGPVQVVPFPHFQHNIAQPFPLSTQLTGGFRRSLGLFVDSTLQVPIAPGLRLGADLGIFTNRGVMFGPSGRYENPESPDDLHGYFRSGYINDHGDKKTDIRGLPVPEDRGYVEWQHQQLVAENLTLTAQLNYWRDSEVLRDFRPRAFFPVQEPDTFVESVYTGPNFFVSAFGRFQPNKFHRVQERLPEIRFDVLPSAIGGGFNQRFNAGVALLREDLNTGLTTTAPSAVTSGGLQFISPPLLIPPLPSLPTAVVNTPGGTLFDSQPFTYVDSSGRPIASPNFLGAVRRVTRVDAYYAIERPIAPTEWFAVTPLAGGRLTSYSRTGEVATAISGSQRLPVALENGSYTRVLGEVGFDSALRMNGAFDYKNPQWKIDGLRHLFTPRLSYRYIPEADKGRDRIIPIDREVFSTYLPPLGLGDVRNIDDLHATNTLRLGFDNVLQTRDTALGSRDLLVFNVANDFRFKRQPGERNASEIHTEMALMPASWLQFDLYQSFAPQNFSVRELNSGITLHDGNAWAVRFGNNYLRRDIQDFSFDGRARLNEKYEARTRLQYDVRRKRFTEQAYGIVQNLGNTWLVSYMVTLYSGRSRESSFGFRIDVDAVRF